MQNRKLLFGILAAVVVVAAAGLLWWQNKNAVKAYEFAGSIEQIQGTEIKLNGLFVVDNRPDLASEKNRTTVQVSLSDQTKIIREAVYLPKPEDLGEDKSFKVDDLRKEQEQVTFTQLQTDWETNQMSLRVKSDKNIYGKSKFKVSEISYKVAVQPLDQQ
ncbi:MAG: hypothetical protein HY545_00145 [Candidatus Doudnabacteria bacterium]|nr:hypothetical protein [Candidatus Doudnabacteria bacterium]